MTYEECQKHLRNWTISWVINTVALAITIVLLVSALLIPMMDLVYVVYPLLFFGWWWNKYYVDVYGEIAKAAIDEYGKSGF